MFHLAFLGGIFVFPWRITVGKAGKLVRNPLLPIPSGSKFTLCYTSEVLVGSKNFATHTEKIDAHAGSPNYRGA